MPKSARSEHPAGVIEEIAEKIHARIASGIYRPGDRLKQELLAEEFGVSRTPVREALSRLDTRGIVRQEARRSAIVNAPSPHQVKEMYQIRAELEGLAAQLAATWISDDALAELQDAHQSFIAAAESVRVIKTETKGLADDNKADQLQRLASEWIEANGRFHDIIIRASGNSSLRRILVEATNGYVRNLMQSSAAETSHHRMADNIRGHSAVLAAIEAHDPAASRKAMAEHVLEAGEFVTNWFERQEDRRL